MNFKLNLKKCMSLLCIVMVLPFLISCQKNFKGTATITDPAVPIIPADLTTKVTASLISGFITDGNDFAVKDATVNTVNLYNLAGQKIANWDVKGREQSIIQIPIKNLPAEIYIVKIKTTQGEFNKKIIIK